MTVSGNKNTVHTVSVRQHTIERDFEKMKKDFISLNKAVIAADEEINANLRAALETINTRIDGIEAALLLSPVKRWWAGFRGKLLNNAIPR